MSNIKYLKEKVTQEAVDKLLSYSAYCTDETKAIWISEVKRIAESIKTLPSNMPDSGKTLYEDDELSTLQLTGYYLEALSKGGTLDDVLVSFELQGFSDSQEYMMCRNLLVYTENGAEFVRRAVEDEEGLPPIVEEMINQKGDKSKTTIIGNISIMIDRHIPWSKIVKYFKSLNLDEEKEINICNTLIRFFPGGYSFVAHLYGNNAPMEVANVLKEVEEDIRKELVRSKSIGSSLDNDLNYGIHELPKSFYGIPPEYIKITSLEQAKLFTEWNEKNTTNPNIHKRTLFSYFREREQFYEELTRLEMEEGSDGVDYRKSLANLRAKRIEMNKILQMVKDNPVPYVYASLSGCPEGNKGFDEVEVAKFESFLARFIRIYHNLPAQTSSELQATEDMKVRDLDFRSGFEKEAAAIYGELHGRAVVEEIDEFLCRPDVEKELRNYLITKKNKILSTHPEVENWYLKIAFFNSQKALKSFDPIRVPILRSYQRIFRPTHYALMGIKSEIINDCDDTVMSVGNNDYKQVYAGIRISALRRFLSEGDNLSLDYDIQSLPRFSTRVSGRAKELLFSRKYKEKQIEVEKREKTKLNIAVAPRALKATMKTLEEMESDIEGLLSDEVEEKLSELCSYCLDDKAAALSESIDYDLDEIEGQRNARSLAEQQMEKYLLCGRVLELIHGGKSKNRIRRFLQANVNDKETLEYICHTLLEYTPYGVDFVDYILNKDAIAQAKIMKENGIPVQTISEVPYVEPEWYQEAKRAQSISKLKEKQLVKRLLNRKCL